MNYVLLSLFNIFIDQGGVGRTSNGLYYCISSTTFIDDLDADRASNIFLLPDKHPPKLILDTGNLNNFLALSSPSEGHEQKTNENAKDGMSLPIAWRSSISQNKN